MLFSYDLDWFCKRNKDNSDNVNDDKWQKRHKEISN